MTNPNPKQKIIIESHEGIYLVDAGPGTGKTYTLTNRYINLLKNQVDPHDILLITFTRNAADQLREKIRLETDIKENKVNDAPISTFHSHCKKIIDRHGFNTPRYLGIDDQITNNTKTIESKVLEARHFHRYINQFKEKHPEHKEYYILLNNETNLLNLIKSLAVKGIIPTENGWYRDSEKHLEGDLREFRKQVEKTNKPNGNKQSKLRRRLNGYKYNCFCENAPKEQELRGGRGTKQANTDLLIKAFNEDRRELKKFIHDIYYEYLEYTLSKNYLNFSFHLLWAYVLLVENHRLQQEIGFQYIMIDEFQDTNEIQLKLSLLLSRNGNICVVGDWKQSIYSFQYADVQNILNYKKRLKKHRKTLNKDHNRIKYPVSQINEVNLKQNYRSGQEIIDFSETALTLKATQNEQLKKTNIKEKITHLNSNTDFKGHVNAIHSPNEKQTILTKIQEITSNPNYTTKENGRQRQLKYKDIAVLTRNRRFGIELQEQARKHGLPAAFEGGVNLFTTNPAIILLAWLRILNHQDSKKGWAVILENAGYNLDEAKHILKTKQYPEYIQKYRQKLLQTDSLTGIAKQVFNKYGIDNAFSSKITEVLDSVYKNSLLNLGEIIKFFEENIETQETYEVDTSYRENIVTIQTIHGAKGLEYPVVFISNVNQKNFPSPPRNKGNLQYNDLTGIRQKKKYKNQETPFLHDNWKTYIVNRCIDPGYSEERRLMYVAMTRAEKYLYITAETQKQSQFYRDLNIKKQETKPKTKKQPETKPKTNKFKIKNTRQKTPAKIPMNSLIEKTTSTGRGTEFGIKTHKFAEKYAKNKQIKPTNQDERNIKKLIDNLQGKLITEKKCTLPIKKQRKIILTGKIDLIHKTKNKIEIIDYKTEKSIQTKKPYQKQLSLYYHTLKKIYKNHEIHPYIYYTETGQKTKIKPIKLRKIINKTP